MKFSKENLRDLIVEEIGAFLNEATPKYSREEEEWLRANAKKGLKKLHQRISSAEDKYKGITSIIASQVQPALQEAIYNAIVSDEGFLRDLQSGAPGVERLYAGEFTQDLVDELQSWVPDIVQAVIEDIYDLGTGETGEQPVDDVDKTAPALKPLPSGGTQQLDPRE